MDVPRPARTKLRVPLLAVAGGLALVAVSLLFMRLQAAAPVVEREALWIDVVRRGEFVRQVSGPGALVPEQIRFVSARSAGRVERILVEPGTAVDTDTPLVVLSSPELELEALEARRQHGTAESGLLDLQATLEGERLALRGELARIRAEYQNARRRAAANDQLAEHDMVSTIEHAASRDLAAQLAEHVKITRERLRFHERSSAARIAAQQAEVQRLADGAAHHAGLVAALTARAGQAGVLQELPLEVGQAVAPGDLLAKVVDPTQLLAELRIAESQAREIALGQSVEIDTRSAQISGRVTRIDPSVQRGTVTVDVALLGELPAGARPDLSVDGSIELERVPNTLFTGRPATSRSRSRGSLFRLSPDGSSAERVPVEFGGQSASSVEIRSGLDEGDRVVLSDTSQWEAVDRIRID